MLLCNLIGRYQFHIVDVKLIARGGIVGKPEHEPSVVHKAVEVGSGEGESVRLPIVSEVDKSWRQSVIGIRRPVLKDRDSEVVACVGVGGEIELIRRVGL